ncbi:MAG: helix-hairpin-helix domain-containing protein [Desulfobacula sp.]|nr:helix-hairpin-helix domain-containing protein [Desulfobacula sp.]
MKQLKKISIIFMVSMLLIAFFQPVYAGSKKININTAIKTELTGLKYVGDVIAVRIMEYRKGQLFQKPEELMKVKGVGQKIFEANKQIIVVQDK